MDIVTIYNEYNLIKKEDYFEKFIKVPGLIKLGLSWEE